MEAVSRKERTAVIHKATRARCVRQILAFKENTKNDFYFFYCLIFLLLSWSVPNCVLTKELLTDGLKVLVSKEDELLYAARVQTLELPDM